MAMETTGVGRQYMDAVPDKTTSIDECNAAFSDARELAAEVNALVSRFVGPLPPEATEAKAQSIPQASGLLHDLADNSRRAREAVAYALKSLRRLESHLP